MGEMNFPQPPILLFLFLGVVFAVVPIQQK
jgi:hypothetical protein